MVDVFLNKQIVLFGLCLPVRIFFLEVCLGREMTEVGAYPCLKHLRYPQFRNRSVFHTDKAREH